MKRSFALHAGLPSIILLTFSFVLILTACKKDPPVGGTAATGSLQDSKGLCLPNTVHGSYYIGAALTDSNYVEVSVNVTRAGTYKINTDKKNGVIFADSGIFHTNGLTSIRLRPTGTFTSAGSTTFTFGFDSSSCQFTVNAIDSTNLAQGAWRINFGGQQYDGVANSSIYLLTYPIQRPTQNNYLLEIGGETPNNPTHGDGFNVKFTMTSDSVYRERSHNLGTYYTSSPESSFTFVIGQDTLYYANPSTTGKVMSITLDTVALTPSGLYPVLIGRFGGNVTNRAGASVPVTGAFSSIVF